MPLLELRDLRTVLATPGGPTVPVDGLSFSLEAGERVGLVGESGCGKSMAALSILGLLPDGARMAPGSSIAFRGQELVGMAPREVTRVRGRGIGAVFQDPMASLNPVRTVGSQLREVLRVRMGMGRREARRGAIRLLEEVEFPDAARRVESWPHELSGGQRQRVALAGALACEPALLLADEPTTALDVTIQARILHLLDRICRERQMALLLITHDMGVVARHCDRILVMYAGQIVEDGPTAPTFDTPLHPYTRALLDARPSIEAHAPPPRPIPGRVPHPASHPEGCRFRPRCARAFDPCSRPPSLEPAGEDPGRRARCWLHQDPGEAS